MPAFWCSDLCKACWTVSGLRLQAYGHRGTGLGSQAESLSTLPLRPGIRGVSSEERGGLLGSMWGACGSKSSPFRTEVWLGSPLRFLFSQTLEHDNTLGSCSELSVTQETKVSIQGGVSLSHGVWCTEFERKGSRGQVQLFGGGDLDLL